MVATAAFAFAVCNATQGAMCYKGPGVADGVRCSGRGMVVPPSAINESSCRMPPLAKRTVPPDPPLATSSVPPLAARVAPGSGKPPPALQKRLGVKARCWPSGRTSGGHRG